MSAGTSLGRFAAGAEVPAEARCRAAAAFADTIAVTLAGAAEDAARIVRQAIASEGRGPCRVLGTTLCAGAANAALANGTAAHAHDYDDMCFVSLAHPSAPLVAAALAAGELNGAPGAALLDAYVVGFEIEARLGMVMNPRHYQHGWHCTSTLGTIGAAAAAGRVLRLAPAAMQHALAIAGSEASGLKENFGTMVKPLHAGLAARNGVLAALLAAHGMTASDRAIDGPQGFLRVLSAERSSVDEAAADLGRRWEIVDSGITVKLYPSCAGTHPTIDAILDLRRREHFTAGDVERVEVVVDSIVPTILIHDRPADALEAKFSMPFCAAAAVAVGEVSLDTFASKIGDRTIADVMPRVTMRVDPALDRGAPALTQARVMVSLRDGRVLQAVANGARGYPDRPASRDELDAKFLSCARRALPDEAAHGALALVCAIETLPDVRELTARCSADLQVRSGQA